MASLLLVLGPIVAGYLLGAIPSGLIVGRLARGVDLREHGSGNVGATNALRTLGKGPSAVVLLADACKAAVAVLLVRELGAPPLMQALAGLAAVVGHCWSAYIGFGGGKGVSCSLGSALAISPPVGVFAALVFAATVARTRYVSLGSLVGAGLGALVLLGTVAAGQLDPGYAPLALAAGVVFYRHRGNIARLRAGTERRLGDQASTAPTARLGDKS